MSTLIIFGIWTLMDMSSPPPQYCTVVHNCAQNIVEFFKIVHYVLMILGLCTIVGSRHCTQLEIVYNCSPSILHFVLCTIVDYYNNTTTLHNCSQCSRHGAQLCEDVQTVELCINVQNCVIYISILWKSTIVICTTLLHNCHELYTIIKIGHRYYTIVHCVC